MHRNWCVIVFDTSDPKNCLRYRIAYGEASRLIEIRKFDHAWGRDFAAGTEQEISSSYEHLEGDTKDACFLVSILQVRARVVSFFVLLPQEHSACMGRLPRLYPAPRFDESMNRL